MQSDSAYCFKKKRIGGKVFLERICIFIMWFYFVTFMILIL